MIDNITAKGRKLGVWMDHSSAELIEFLREDSHDSTITSQFTHQVKADSLSKSEKGMHSKEQHEQAAYYKKIGDAILNYQDVLLFGPTQAKTELLNILEADKNFSHVKIRVEHADNMTEGQRHAFVKHYFEHH